MSKCSFTHSLQILIIFQNNMRFAVANLVVIAVALVGLANCGQVSSVYSAICALPYIEKTLHQVCKREVSFLKVLANLQPRLFSECDLAATDLAKLAAAVTDGRPVDTKTSCALRLLEKKLSTACGRPLCSLIDYVIKASRSALDKCGVTTKVIDQVVRGFLLCSKTGIKYV